MDPLSIEAAASERPDDLFVVLAEQRLTFAEAARCARPIAAELLAMGAGRAVPITFVASTSIATVLVYLAALEVGVPVAPQHPRWTEAERERAVALLPEALRVDPEALLASVAGRADGPSERPEISDDDIGAILFTSGTSAEPKGVLLARRAFGASALAHHTNVPFLPRDRWVLAMPLSHAGGLSILTRCLAYRSTVVLLEAWSVAAATAAIRRERATLLSVVPTMLSALLSSVERTSLPSLRAILVGGAHCPPALRQRALAASWPILATYGLTETCSQIVTQRPGRDAGTGVDSGYPLEGAEIRILRRDGLLAKTGQVGEIVVRGDMVMNAYIGERPRARDGWMPTGDEGVLDAEGRLTVLGRADDTIITGGENVFPADVEHALAACEGVRAAAVFGSSDPRWGQVVSAALVLAPGVDVAQVFAQVTSKLAKFKRPRRAVVLDALPATASGKISRRRLAAELEVRLEPVIYDADK